MGRYFTLTLAGSHPASKTKTQKQKTKKTLKNFRKLNFGFILTALAVMLTVGYLVQVNSLSTKGYEIRQLELAVRELKETGKRLELEVSGLQSIQSIEEDIEALNLVPGGTVKYVADSEFALNN